MNSIKNILNTKLILLILVFCFVGIVYALKPEYKCKQCIPNGDGTYDRNACDYGVPNGPTTWGYASCFIYWSGDLNRWVCVPGGNRYRAGDCD